MANVHDVAAYVLSKSGRMSAMKLQKLVYYCQAWHLAWEERPLFPERIEAWANGPVVYELFDLHRGRFTLDDWPQGDPAKLNWTETDTVDAVLRDYGELNARKLSHLTHSERPWRDAREGLAPDDRSSREITQGAMHEYYSSLDADTDAQSPGDLDWEAWEHSGLNAE